MDSIVVDTFKVNTEYYNYNEKKELLNLQIDDFNSYYSPNKKIKLINSTYQVKNRIGTTNDITIQLDNYSKETFIIRPKFDSNTIHIKSNELKLKPLCKNSFTFTLTTLPNLNDFKIYLENVDFQFPIIINTFGFDLSSEDLNSAETIELNRQFIYYRFKKEALLEILDIYQEKVLETVSLAIEKKHIDLSNLELGEYWFRFTIYAFDETKLIKVKLE